jgi:hypothetical protein
VCTQIKTRRTKSSAELALLNLLSSSSSSSFPFAKRVGRGQIAFNTSQGQAFGPPHDLEAPLLQRASSSTPPLQANHYKGYPFFSVRCRRGPKNEESKQLFFLRDKIIAHGGYTLLAGGLARPRHAGHGQQAARCVHLQVTRVARVFPTSPVAHRRAYRFAGSAAFFRYARG